ncbi:probable cytochrome P450 12a5, mitochondrial [Trichonephila clavipes]|nr:probable cytochrome P450 12a5, mitochondrial [Trichonephila clavipes]
MVTEDVDGKSCARVDVDDLITAETEEVMVGIVMDIDGCNNFNDRDTIFVMVSSVWVVVVIVEENPSRISASEAYNSVSSETPKRGTTSQLTGAGSLLPLLYREVCAKGNTEVSPGHQFTPYGKSVGQRVPRTQFSFLWDATHGKHVGWLTNCGSQKKTLATIPYHELFIHEKYYEEPLKFIPERWIDKNKDFNPFAFVPFGFGPRSCIGKRLAELEISLFVTELIRNFKIEYHYEDIGVKTLLANVPDKPLRFSFVER